MAKRIMRKGAGLKTLGLGNLVSKHSDEAKRTVTEKTPVRRIQVSDPSRALTDEKVAKQFTNNPNLKYQPTGVNPRQETMSASGVPGVKKVRTPSPPKGSTTNRGKVLRRITTKIKRR